MQRRIIVTSLVLLLFSCATTKKLSYNEEAVNFYMDVLSQEQSFCSRKVNNDYWIKEFEDLRLAAMRNYLDSVGSKTADNYSEFEEKYKVMTLKSVSIPGALTVDYENVLAVLRVTNNMRFSKFADCDSASTGHISFPIFDIGRSKAIIETEGGTFLFEKVNGRWTFRDRGLFRVY